MWFLAGLPGKLKVLTDRLSAGRANNLDNLNATMTSRAPASTALNNTIWTDDRAGKLDAVTQSRGVIAAGFPTTFSTSDTQPSHLTTAVTSSSLVDVVNVTGSGFIAFLSGTSSYQWNSVSGVYALKSVTQLVLTVDGAVVSNIETPTPSGSLNGTTIFHHNLIGAPEHFLMLPFATSLRIQARRNTLTGSPPASTVRYAYFRTS